MRKQLFLLKIVLFLSVIAVSACTKIIDKPGEKPGKNTPSDLKPNQTIIEAGDNMEAMFGKNYKKWTPAESDIEIAEKQLFICFDDQKRGTVNRLLNRKPEDYTMQFVGAINESGEKIIWINCFCSSEINSFKNWKTNIVRVRDGGTCFFNVRINVDKNTYYDLMVNGDG